MAIKLLRILSFILFISTCAFAQPKLNKSNRSGYLQSIAKNNYVLKNTKQNNLRALSIKHKKEIQASIEKTHKVAKEKGWITKSDNKDGTIELQLLDITGAPIYYTTYNKGAGVTSSTNQLWSGGNLGLNLNGEGMLAGIWDAGVIRASHQEFEKRAIQKDKVSTIYNSHATHVAGTIMAAGKSAEAKGMAFKANLNAYEWNYDNSEMATAAANGLLISNHSYGILAGFSYNTAAARWEWAGSYKHTEDYKFGWYDAKSQIWDEIAYNAPHYLIVKAAGNNRSSNGPADNGVYWYRDASMRWVSAVYNDRPVSRNNQYDNIPTFGTAKNILTVGAVQNIAEGYFQPSDVKSAPFSSWGPTDDGRIKPDIVAKGVNLYSSIGGSDTQYNYYSGTSMASPVVTGSLLLLQQHYQQLNRGTSMKAATLKGLVLHTADEAGAAPGPDYTFGWGLLDTKKSAEAISNTSGSHLIAEYNLQDKQIFTKTINVKGGEPLVATICWTDLQGPMIENFTIDNALNNKTLQLVNDLDIRISDGISTWSPYILDPANPSYPATTGDNFRDNVEKIYIAAPKAGTYTISISHKNNLVTEKQDFSLILSGLSSTGIFQCSSQGNLAGNEWIEAFELGNLKNTSGNNNGFGNFSSMTTELEKESEYTFKLTPGFADSAYSQLWKIWIDYNGNGVFEEENESIFQSESTNNIIAGKFVIPASAQTGLLKLRVSMKHGAAPAPCEFFQYGEVEDYSVLVKDKPVCLAPDTFNIKNLSYDEATIQWPLNELATQYTIRYRLAGTLDWIYKTTTADSIKFEHLIPATNYDVELQSSCSFGNGLYSKTFLLTTLAHPSTYCYVKANDSSKEWISNVNLNNISLTKNHKSDQDELSTAIINLSSGESHSFDISTMVDSDSSLLYCNLWIDYNQNGSYEEDTEKAYSSGSSNNTLFKGTIDIPSTAHIGQTKMRVVFRKGSSPSACGIFERGEAEDYTIQISAPLQVIAGPVKGKSELQQTNVSIYPNPAAQSSTISINAINPGQKISISAFDSRGNQVFSKNWISAGTTFSHLLDLTELTNGMYYIRISVDSTYYSKRLIVIP